MRCDKKGLKVELLDGEMVRGLFPQTGFTRPERDDRLQGFRAPALKSLLNLPILWTTSGLRIGALPG